jgi:uncharacterized protein
LLILKYLKIALAAYAILLLVVFFIQRLILLHPKSLPKNHQFKFDIPHQESFISPEEGIELNQIKFSTNMSSPLGVRATVATGVLFYLHGNSDNLDRWGKHAEDFTRRDYDVVMYDFRGFGKSNGRLTEKNLLQDAQFIYDSIKKDYPENKIVVYGRSLGTGVATKLAANNAPKMLILETPYYSLPDVGWEHFPFFPYRWISEFKMPSYQWIQQVRCPIHLFHGTDDEIVPYNQSLKLAKTLDKNPDEIMTTLKGGHHRGLAKFAEYQKKLDELLK